MEPSEKRRVLPGREHVSASYAPDIAQMARFTGMWLSSLSFPTGNKGLRPRLYLSVCFVLCALCWGVRGWPVCKAHCQVALSKSQNNNAKTQKVGFKP